MIYSYATTAQQYFENLFAGKNLHNLNISLAEAFNNVFNHSESPVQGYVLTQFYPNKKKIFISVCDLGIGIPTSLNNYYKKNNLPSLLDSIALEKSFEFGVSSKSTPQNKGQGLGNILAQVKGLNGRFKCASILQLQIL